MQHFQNSFSSLSVMSSRLHPFFRLFISAIAVVLAMVLVFVVIAAALQTAAISSGKTTSPDAFFARNALFVQVLLYPPALLALWACRRGLDKMSFRSLGLRANGFFSSFASGALAAILTLSLLFGTLYLCGLVRVNGLSDEYSKAGTNAFTTLFLTALAFLAVGFFEEFTFRGYALHNLHSWLGTKWAIAIQAIVFGLIHIGNVSTPQALIDARWGVVNIALIGIFFALCYLKSGSLWFPIGFHAAWNFALGSLFSLPVSGLTLFRVLDVSVAPSWLTGGTFGLEGSVLLTPLLIALCWVLSKLPDHAQAQADLRALRSPLSSGEIATQSDTQIHDSSPSHLASIRASMRPESPQPQLVLRGLNTMNPQPKAPSFEIFTPASTPETMAATSSTRSDVSPTVANEIETRETIADNISFPPLAVETATQKAEPETESALPIVNEVALPELASITPIEVLQKPIEVVETISAPLVETPVSEPVIEPKPKPKKPTPKW